MAIDMTTVKQIMHNNKEVAKIEDGLGNILWQKQSAKVLQSITLSGQTTSLNRNAAFSFGGVVTANYSDGSTANVTSNTTFSGYNMSVSGTYTVTASYTENSTTVTATYSLTVKPIPVTISFAHPYCIKQAQSSLNYWVTKNNINSVTAMATSEASSTTFYLLTAAQINAINNQTYTSNTSVGVTFSTFVSSPDSYFICYIDSNKMHIVGNKNNSTANNTALGSTIDTSVGRHYYSYSASYNGYRFEITKNASLDTSHTRWYVDGSHRLVNNTGTTATRVSFVMNNKTDTTKITYNK